LAYLSMGQRSEYIVTLEAEVTRLRELERRLRAAAVSHDSRTVRVAEAILGGQ
jgi:hypothetical protein